MLKFGRGGVERLKSQKLFLSESNRQETQSCKTYSKISLLGQLGEGDTRGFPFLTLKKVYSFPFSFSNWAKKFKFGMQNCQGSQMCFLGVSTFQTHGTPSQPQNYSFLNQFNLFLLGAVHQNEDTSGDLFIAYTGCSVSIVTPFISQVKQHKLHSCSMGLPIQNIAGAVLQAFEFFIFKEFQFEN